jgi:formate-dependent nitrite reductase membrane component NrfD
MGGVRSRLRPLSGPAVGFLLLIPVALFITASIFKYAVGIPLLYEGLGFLADPRRLPWYNRVSPILFLVGPLVAAAVNLAAIIKLESRREDDRLVTTITFTPRRLNVAVAVVSLVLLALLVGYLLAENLGPA